MATRVITAKAPKNVGALDGESVAFAVTSDTGPVYSGAITSATIAIYDIITQADVKLLVKFDSASGSALAVSKKILQDPYGKWSIENVDLTECANGLLTRDPSTIYLTVSVTGNVFGADPSSHIVYYQSTITITIEYMARCTEPSNVRLSATQSAGDSVLLSWSAGTGTTDNTFDHYEVKRQYSTDGGGTWSGWETVGQTANTYMWVYPPETAGHLYQYYVRTVGSAGDDYASYWAQSSNTLRKKVYPALIAYTDPTITAGVTRVKAVHITELQTNVNLTRAAANFVAYTFTAIRASYTSLAGWNAHILELRAAIDGMGIAHETWLALGDNCPRADVLMQLRRVVEAVAND